MPNTNTYRLLALTFLAAAQMFFPAADTKQTAFDGATVRIENGAAVVDVAPTSSGSTCTRTGQKYKAYVRAAIKDEHLVGVHWFYWHDMPLTGSPP